MPTPGMANRPCVKRSRRTGSMPEYRMSNPKTKDGFRVVGKKYWGPLGGTTAEATWQRLFFRMEATALAVFADDRIWMENLGHRRAESAESITGYRSRRPADLSGGAGEATPRPGRHHESRNLTDDGAAQRGRLITHACERPVRPRRGRSTRRRNRSPHRLANRKPRLGERPQRSAPARGPFRFGVSLSMPHVGPKAKVSPARRFARTPNRDRPQSPRTRATLRGNLRTHLHLGRQTGSTRSRRSHRGRCEDALSRANKAVLVADYVTLQIPATSKPLQPTTGTPAPAPSPFTETVAPHHFSCA